MSSSRTAQLATIFVSAVKSSRNARRPLTVSHRRLTLRSHTRRSRVADSLRKQQFRTYKNRKDVFAV